jgi:DNA repair exonuclease SbcCD ATPase subunit
VGKRLQRLLTSRARRDPALNALRQRYEAQVRALAQVKGQLESQPLSVEQVAQILFAQRTDCGITPGGSCLGCFASRLRSVTTESTGQRSDRRWAG